VLTIICRPGQPQLKVGGFALQARQQRIAAAIRLRWPAAPAGLVFALRLHAEF
jgi:hypothetical protein